MGGASSRTCGHGAPHTAPRGPVRRLEVRGQVDHLGRRQTATTCAAPRALLEDLEDLRPDTSHRCQDGAEDDHLKDVLEETSNLPWAKLWRDYRRATDAWRSFADLAQQKNEQLFEAAKTGKSSVIVDLLGSTKESGLEGLEGSVGPLTAEAKGLYGRTALRHLAALSGQLESSEADGRALLSLGAKIDAQTDSGFTPFHLACRHGHLELADLLLQNGCDVSLQADQGETALHLAAQHGQSHLVNFLLANAPELYSVRRNNFGQRPVEVSLDATTALSFQHMASSVASSSSSFQCWEPMDQYAGRSLFQNVLLRNSRVDAVQRLSLGERGGRERPHRSRLAGAIRPGQPRPVGGVARRSQERSSDEVVGPKSFRILSLLGRGSFGEVFQVAQKSTGQIFAMKVLRKNKIIGRNLMRYALTERNLLSYIRHPFIVSWRSGLGIFWDAQCSANPNFGGLSDGALSARAAARFDFTMLFRHQAVALDHAQRGLVLVLQYYPGGNVSALLQREGHLPEALAKLYTAEVLLAIEHLHERNVVYRDLKPENIVLDEDGHAVLTDFGLSKEGVDALYGTKSFCGSVAYLAPEILSRQGHGRTVDLYGLGVLLYEFIEGSPPYYSRDRDTLFRNIVAASLSAPARCSLKCQQLIVALMQRDPAKRLGRDRTSDVRALGQKGG
ncbi:Protein kinase 2 (PK2) [Durusdinium trenchii]|uniref:Protein kinase 2 (PK2) n=1 Tax=Durusdinium trenchii TaxID=1381693 RepID=A0ABP0KA94_9DINO